ncbi:MAG: adenylate/guanylate cyclase domain-containing protein [Deltaproteobacteria bacterium]|nr:adenylate/guanylate cyclase domain-containing protein [Deltaproteobacteria bacterium]
MLRSRKLLRLVAFAAAGAALAATLALLARGSAWTQYDYKVLDLFYRQAVQRGQGPKQSPQVVYLTITDRTYDYFAKNILDRKDLSRVNDALARLGVEAVAYDVIFARPSRPEADESFAESLRRLGCAYLPIGLAYTAAALPFRWEEGRAYERFRRDYLRKPAEKGAARPYYATRALMQYDAFQEAAFNSGHISAYSDPDGVYRHLLTLLRVEDAYVPTLALSMFLDHMRVPFEKTIVHWGESITIPALKESFLEKDLVIPIDERGRTFIPFPAAWDEGFKKMEAQTLLKTMQDESMAGNLTDFFEGKFVLIGDISVGTSDLGHIPLESDAPLIMVHASMLNALLTQTFYHKRTFGQALTAVWLIALFLALAATLRSTWFLYLAGLILVAGLTGLTWIDFTGFRLFPVFTVGGSGLFVFFALVTSLEVAVGRERSFIKGAFARYVPEKVVDTLLSSPEMLKLGGEERVMSVLFSDLAGFTTISEKMTPSALVHLLNQYLTEMTQIVLAGGGIIDKYEGDAIMAEFGAPLPLPDHADRAVRAGLTMQRRLKELREIWKGQGLPELRCRVGINTGSMIVGNMGSSQVFDYTVIGDSVNLASRLEGANKRYNTYLMISETTLGYLSPGLFRTRVLDVIKVKGKTRAVKVFEVIGETPDPVEPNDAAYYDAYEEAFERYLSRDFDTARGKFREALSLRPEDPASLDMMGRMDGIDPNELPPDWDGSIALTSK